MRRTILCNFLFVLAFCLRVSNMVVTGLHFRFVCFFLKQCHDKLHAKLHLLENTVTLCNAKYTSLWRTKDTRHTLNC